MIYYNNELEKIKEEIINDSDNLKFTNIGWLPVYSVSSQSKIIIIGQAPGIKAQESKIPWNDVSGNKLREWLGVTRDQFYDPNIFALMPMDFYYPGKGKSGDLPPRKLFASKWHPRILANMNEFRLIILVGSYSQKYYLNKLFKENLSKTVQSYQEYLPRYFPLVHPSPLNKRWLKNNPWFENETIIDLKAIVRNIISIDEIF